MHLPSMHNNYHELDADELLRQLGTDAETGLTSQRAANLLERDGPNELTSSTKSSVWIELLREVPRGPIFFCA